MPPRKGRGRKRTAPKDSLRDNNEISTSPAVAEAETSAILHDSPRSPTPPRDDRVEEEAASKSAVDAVEKQKKAVPRTVTNFSETEKDDIIEFLKRNPCIYEKRLTDYTNSLLKEKLWADQAIAMNRTAKELQTWYDSMRTKLGKLKKEVRKSGQAADQFTPTERWVWERFSFLASHIQECVRRNVASFNDKLQPVAESLSETEEARTPSCTVSISPCIDPSPSQTTSASASLLPPTSARSDALASLLEKFIGQRQSTSNSSTCFGSYVDSSIRGFPPYLRREAEMRIMQVLHDCQSKADQNNIQAPPQTSNQAPSQTSNQAPPEASYQPPPQQFRQQLQPQFNMFPLKQQRSLDWQPPPEQWPTAVQGPTSVWGSQDRRWMSQQFPQQRFLGHSSLPASFNTDQTKPTTSSRIGTYKGLLNSQSEANLSPFSISSFFETVNSGDRSISTPPQADRLSDETTVNVDDIEVADTQEDDRQ